MIFDIVIYHANCHDGFSAVTVIYKFLMEKFNTIEDFELILKLHMVHQFHQILKIKILLFLILVIQKNN